MRRIDKKLNMMKANLLAETRHIESKGLIIENNAERSKERLDRLGIDSYTGEKSISGTQKTNPDIIALAKSIINSSVNDIKKEEKLINKVSKENNFDKETEYNLITAVQKGRIKALNEFDTPIGANENNNEMDLEENPQKLDDIMNGIRNIINPYIDKQIGAAIANHNWEVLLEKIPTLFNQSLSRNSKYKDEFGKEYSKLAENSLYEIGPETARKALSYNNDPRQERILQDATNSLFGKYIDKDLNFLFQGSSSGQPAKYTLSKVIPKDNFKHSTVDFYFHNENGIDDDAPYADNKKDIVFTYDIFNDAIINKGNHESKYTVVTQLMNPTAANFFATAAKWIRGIYFKTNPPKINVDGKMTIDSNFNIDSKVKKQDFKMF